MIYTFGPIVFSGERIAPTEVQRDSEYRWVSLALVRQRPGHQFIGIGDETMSFNGIVYAGFSPAGDGNYVGTRRIEEVRALAEQGVPYDLTDGAGNYYGTWFLTSVAETAEHLLANGLPRKQSFVLSFMRYSPATKDNKSVLYNRGVLNGVSNGNAVPLFDTPGQIRG